MLCPLFPFTYSHSRGYEEELHPSSIDSAVLSMLPHISEPGFLILTLNCSWSPTTYRDVVVNKITSKTMSYCSFILAEERSSTINFPSYATNNLISIVIIQGKNIRAYYKGKKIFICLYIWASLVAQMVKNPPAMWETWVRFLGWGDPLEEGMATHSSILAWRISIDRGSWRATVHRATKNWTRLSY